MNFKAVRVLTNDEMANGGDLSDIGREFLINFDHVAYAQPSGEIPVTDRVAGFNEVRNTPLYRLILTTGRDLTILVGDVEQFDKALGVDLETYCSN